MLERWRELFQLDVTYHMTQGNMVDTYYHKFQELPDDFTIDCVSSDGTVELSCIPNKYLYAYGEEHIVTSIRIVEKKDWKQILLAV